MLWLTYKPDEIASDVIVFLLELLPKLTDAAGIGDQIEVQVVPEAVVGDAHGGVGFSAFSWPPTRTGREKLRIYLGAGFVDAMQKDAGDTREEALWGLGHNLAHEIAHWEQW